MRKVGLITSAELPNLHPDERPFLDALAAQQIEGVPIVWTAPITATVDAFVVRTPWDWFRRAVEFDRFLSTLPELRTFNSPSLMRAFLGKDYLFDLRRAGVPIVATELVEGDGEAIASIIAQRGWKRVVIKPVLSACAFRTIRVAHDDDQIAPLGFDRWLVQPYMNEIEEGELSFIFFDGAFSHAVRKRAKAGDFRVQDEHGGTYALENPPTRLIAQAERALAALGPVQLYSRVDGLVVDGALQLMEIEIVEPQLFFRLCADAGKRLAEALGRRLGSSRA